MRFQTSSYGVNFDFVPRHIHQTWQSTELPAAWGAFQSGWQAQHPEWEYTLWTDADNRRLIADRYPWFLSTYDSYPRDIQRVDAAKYFILHAYGGVYLDMDTECLRPIDPLIEDGGLVVSRTPDGVIDGAFLASPPAHAFWDTVFHQLQHPSLLARIVRFIPGGSASTVLLTTGPQMLRLATRRYRRGATEGITVLAPEAVSSRSWLRRKQGFPNVAAYLHHHHADSWLSEKELRLHKHFNIHTLRLIWLALILVLIGFVSWLT